MCFRIKDEMQSKFVFHPPENITITGMLSISKLLDYLSVVFRLPVLRVCMTYEQCM